MRPMGRQEWMPGAVVSTLLVVCSWGYFIWTGSISTIWPMFGIANQLLAAVALAVGTTIIINMGKARYAWVTAAPLAFVAVTTLTAGVLSVQTNFWPMAVGPDPTRHFQGYLNTGLTILMMICVVVILANPIWRCAAGPSAASGPSDGPARLAPVESRSTLQVSRLARQAQPFLVGCAPLWNKHV